MFKRIIMAISLLVMVTTINAQGSMNQVMSYTKIDKVDLNNKTVTISGKTYRYEMLDEEDAFYVADSSTKNMKYLTLGKKYYVNIVYDKFSKGVPGIDIGVVNYIGSVKYAF